MRDAVVGVVRSPPDQVKASQDLAPHPGHRDHAYPAITGAGRPGQHGLYVFRPQGPALHAIQLKRRPGIQQQIPLGHDIQHVGAGDVVAGGMGQALANHLGSAGQTQPIDRIELQQELAAVRVHRLKAGRRTLRLALDDPERRPRPGRVRSGHQLCQRHRAPGVAGAEPGRARHVVPAVHVLGRTTRLQRQHPIDLVGQRITHQQRSVPFLQPAGPGRRGHVLVVVFLPDDRSVRVPGRRLVRAGAPDRTAMAARRPPGSGAWPCRSGAPRSQDAAVPWTGEAQRHGTPTLSMRPHDGVGKTPSCRKRERSGQRCSRSESNSTPMPSIACSVSSLPVTVT